MSSNESLRDVVVSAFTPHNRTSAPAHFSRARKSTIPCLAIGTTAYERFMATTGKLESREGVDAVLAIVLRAHIDVLAVDDSAYTKAAASKMEEILSELSLQAAILQRQELEVHTVPQIHTRGGERGGARSSKGKERQGVSQELSHLFSMSQMLAKVY